MRIHGSKVRGQEREISVVKICISVNDDLILIIIVNSSGLNRVELIDSRDCSLPTLLLLTDRAYKPTKWWNLVSKCRRKIRYAHSRLVSRPLLERDSLKFTVLC